MNKGFSSSRRAWNRVMNALVWAAAALVIVLVAGNSPNMPDSLFRSVTFLTTAIAKEMSYASGLQRQALFSIALVLFVFIMIINVVLNVVLKGGDRND